MSKSSSMKRYTQLMSWLETYKHSPKFIEKKQPKKESRLSYYDKKGIK